MPRFVVLRHETPAGSPRPSHFDFMLEDGGALLTWASVEPLDSRGTLTLEALAEHRLAYLTYEGEVSQNRGQVSRVHAGEFEWIERTPSRLIVDLQSATLAGRATLERAAPASDATRDENETTAAWIWVFTPRSS